MSYQRPETLEQTLSLLARDKWLILAGGTDIYPAQIDRPMPENILDITAMAPLSEIREEAEHWLIGAGVKWNDIHGAAPGPGLRALRQAAREIGGIQIQNSATILGNICNASPAADGVPPLLILEAEIVLQSAEASRCLPLGEFIQGNRRTALAANELATAIRIPKSACGGVSRFIKLGSRKYLVISIAMVAARIAVDDQNNISEIAIAVGACSEVARRLPGLEAKLLGRPASLDLLEIVTITDFQTLSPISDVRADRDYRYDAAQEVTRRVLAACLGDIAGLAED